MPFLVEMFSRSKDIVLTYNVSQGVQFPDKKMRKRCLVAVNARRAIEGEVPIDAFPNSPAHVLPMLERLITDRSQRVAVVLDFFETVVPMSDLSYMGEGDKANLVAMQRWAPTLGPGAITSLCSSPSTSRCAQAWVGSAQPPLRIALPEQDERTAFIESSTRRGRGGDGRCSLGKDHRCLRCLRSLRSLGVHDSQASRSILTVRQKEGDHRAMSRPRRVC